MIEPIFIKNLTGTATIRNEGTGKDVEVKVIIHKARLYEENTYGFLHAKSYKLEVFLDKDKQSFVDLVVDPKKWKGDSIMNNMEISNYSDLIFVEVDCSQDVYEVEADRKNHFFNVKYVSKEVVKDALRKYERVAIFKLDKSLEAKNFIR